jgi:hypothetical protein
MRIAVMVAMGLLVGCIPTEDRTVFSQPTEVNDEKPAEPALLIGYDWIKHDGRECKFRFSQEVVITQGFYRGETGAVMGLRDDGYVVDIYGYHGRKPSGHVVHRDAVVYGVPEAHLELHELKAPTPASRPDDASK